MENTGTEICKHGVLRGFECIHCRVPLTEEGRAILVAAEVKRKLAERLKPAAMLPYSVVVDAGIEIPPPPLPDPHPVTAVRAGKKCKTSKPRVAHRRAGRPPSSPEKMVRDFCEKLKKAILESPRRKLSKVMLKASQTPKTEERRVRIFVGERKPILRVPQIPDKDEGRTSEVLFRGHKIRNDGVKQRPFRRGRLRLYPTRERA